MSDSRILMHADIAAPSAWVVRWALSISPGGAVLDVACGGGRHARHLAGLGHPVDAVDRNRAAIDALAGVPGVRALCADIEGGPWPYGDRQFAAVVVTCYLHRPLFPVLLDALAPGGLLIYETFNVEQPRYGRPTNPAFLLQPGELLAVTSGSLQVLGFEEAHESRPHPAAMQRICAMRME